MEFLCEEDRSQYFHQELMALASTAKLSPQKIRIQLKDWGLELVCRLHEQHPRGFTTNSHDRWYGPGSCPTFGGSGYEQIAGFAGRRG